MSRIPQRIQHVPDVPKNGNYIVLGQHLWSHAETLSEAYRIWSGAGGKIGEDIAIIDASDDFRIYHADGSVHAEKVDSVFVQNWN